MIPEAELFYFFHFDLDIQKPIGSHKAAKSRNS